MKQHIAYAYDNQEQLEEQVGRMTGGHGADSVILCASGPGEELINASMTWIRDKGKIVIVGDLSMTYARERMFGKEAQVLISRAGGPAGTTQVMNSTIRIIRSALCAGRKAATLRNIFVCWPKGGSRSNR